MKKTLLSFVLMLTGVMAAAQVVSPTPADTPQADTLGEVFVVVEVDPEYPGGMDALYNYLSSNIVYPSEAKEHNIQGRVFVSFVIEKDGTVSNIKVLHDIGGGCGDEAIRVVKGMPRWKPGRQHGQRVRTQFVLPINFKLDNQQ